MFKTKAQVVYIALLRSYVAYKSDIYKHRIPTGFRLSKT